MFSQSGIGQTTCTPCQQQLGLTKAQIMQGKPKPIQTMGATQ
jgi:hypothetical protein